MRRRENSAISADCPTIPPPLMEEEELPMTMQVAMFGTDGLLLASDMRVMKQGFGVRGLQCLQDRNQL